MTLAAIRTPWWQEIPEPLWGLIGIVLSVVLSWLVARSQARKEFVRSLEVRDVEDVYQPLLKDLNQIKVQLDNAPYPVAFYFRGTPMEHATFGHVDLSWWGRMKEDGTQLRLDASLRKRLDDLESHCRRYDQERHRMLAEVDAAVSNAFQMSPFGSWAPAGIGQVILEGETVSLSPTRFEGDETKAENAAILARRAAETVESLKSCRELAPQLGILTGKLIALVEGRISQVRARWVRATS